MKRKSNNIMVNIDANQSGTIPYKHALEFPLVQNTQLETTSLYFNGPIEY